ncbi:MULTISPECIES: TetR family transcriptional regulator [Rhizobium/Agrobacterium group]|uniref:TetR family transcriptional regulator n=1 Tax=Rhizobium/Agrobacterium group TaxID=227290 RepID=UPI000E76B27A|nr:TetR family transcriptional regulator [Rhizobium sp. G21]AYD05324.1 TetR family transcriptional regulator [Neorhizobium sp. NCHU2750]MBB1251752.1 TetR family transcriptional regulator [Rhizobium sp. G21]
MVRSSKRDEVLEAIVTIIERDGLTPVTLDAVAVETGMTRAGLLYHFPSREALIQATHEHLTGMWEKELVASAGKSADAATEAERHAAYINVCAKAARRVELLLMLENADNKALGDLWQHIIDRWAPPAPNIEDAAGIDKFIARLAADGLWVHEALSARPLPTALRKQIILRLNELLQNDDSKQV